MDDGAPASATGALSDEIVDQVLEHLLPAARIPGRLSLGKDVGLELAERRVARLDPPAQLAVPTAIALAHEGREPAVGQDRVGDLEPACEGIHPADVGVEQVDRLEALAADLGVEMDATGREPS